MERHARSKLNTQIYEEACEWFVECRAGDLDDAARREFDRWLRKSPEHLRAYLEIAAIWNEGPSLDPGSKWDTDALIAAAAEDRDNVVAMAAHSRAEQPAKGKEIATKRWRLLAIAASICIMAVGALILTQAFRVQTFVTAVGEQRSIVLVDGSTVELNSRSKVKVRFSEQQRDVELLEGQALFSVAKDHARPFVVSSGATRVRAVGTQFDVYRKRAGTVVTVVEGRVAVLAEPTTAGGSAVSLDPRPERSAKPSILVSAGEQLTITRQAAQRTEHPNIAGATAWRQREIVFESASLFEVAEEFNRYNERQLLIDDSELHDFHVSGVFSSTDPGSLIRFLRERPDLHVIETASEIRVSKK